MTHHCQFHLHTSPAFNTFMKEEKNKN
jgi:hypothetical protein